MISLRERALRLLARREHSRAELARKLAAYAGVEAVEALLDSLESEGLLSNRRYVEALVHSYAGRYGSLKLKHTLEHQGVMGEEAEQAVQQARAADLAACQALWQRKFGTPPRGPKEKARQYRFLLGRGYPPEVVAHVVAGKDVGEADIAP